jgi:hypothetical protein
VPLALQGFIVQTSTAAAGPEAIHVNKPSSTNAVSIWRFIPGLLSPRDKFYLLGWLGLQVLICSFLQRAYQHTLGFPCAGRLVRPWSLRSYRDVIAYSGDPAIVCICLIKSAIDHAACRNFSPLRRIQRHNSASAISGAMCSTASIPPPW